MTWQRIAIIASTAVIAALTVLITAGEAIVGCIDPVEASAPDGGTQ